MRLLLVLSCHSQVEATPLARGSGDWRKWGPATGYNMVWRGEGNTELAFGSSCLIDSVFKPFEFPVNQEISHTKPNLWLLLRSTDLIHCAYLFTWHQLVETISTHPFRAQPLQAFEFVKAGWKKTRIRRVEEGDRRASPKGAEQGNLAQNLGWGRSP